LRSKSSASGSVGTFCEVALFRDAQSAPLFLQIKEARASVLEPYAGRSLSSTHGQRVVYGQRLNAGRQRHISGLDVGLQRGRQFYVRQLRDMKIRCRSIRRIRGPRLFRRRMRLGAGAGACANGRSCDNWRVSRIE